MITSDLRGAVEPERKARWVKIGVARRDAAAGRGRAMRLAMRRVRTADAIVIVVRDVRVEMTGKMGK